MPTVHSISFDVRFDLTSAPTLILTDTTTTFPVGSIGIFSITQPDGYTRTGNFLIPDVNSSGGTFSELLRFDSDGNVQCGTYKIVYEIKTTDTVVTTFTREFIYQYKPVEHKFETNIDVFTPEYYSKDITNYSVAGYNNTAPTRLWTASSIPTGILTDYAQKFDIDYLGNYYDAQYTVSLQSTLLYTHQTYAWLTVNEKITSSFVFDACTPIPIEDLIDDIEQLRIDNIACNGELPKFEKAQSLFTHLMDTVKMAVVGDVVSEKNIYDLYQDLLFELDRVQVCNHTNGVINEYDLSKYLTDRYDTEGSYCTVIGDGNTAEFTINHSLNDDCVIVQVYNYLTKEMVLCDIKIYSKDEIILTFNTAPDVNQYLVVVHAGTSHLKGREIQIQNNGTHIQWRYEGDVAWTNLVALSTLIGPQGPAGATGVTGATGAPGAGIATGGTVGQFLRKNSVTNYDTTWDTLDAGDIPDLSVTYLTKATYDADNDGQVDDAEKITVIARNSTGSTIYKGMIVYLSGSTGNRPNMVKAQANSEATSSKTFGVVIDDTANNADGRVAKIGTLHDLDTRNNAPNPFTTDVLVDGDLLWLSPTNPGYVTRVKPSAPNHMVFVGHVARTSPTNGRIVYSITNGFELSEIHDIAFLNTADKDILAYNSATSLWGNITKAAWLGGLSTQFVKGDGSLQTATFLTSESDPVFAASPAGAITNTNISNWNAAHGWGDHALAGYLTQAQAATTYITTAGSYANPSWLTSLAWSKITGKPTTIAGYGIIDSLLYESGSYANPSWITSLAWSKITGTPTTLFDYGITDALSSSASYTNPSFIVSLAWSKITGTPTTISGYGITNAYTKTEVDNIAANYIPLTQKGAANGVATLDASGLVPSSQLPSYVDDVREYASLGAFPGTGSTGIIYVALDTNETYRWSGSTYVKISNGAVQSVNTLTGNVVLTTTDINEGNSLYYTDARARSAVSLTTTGSSGVATYNSSTGVFNIPSYTLSGLGGVPTSRTLTINGTSYDLSENRSWIINAVTALASLTDVSIITPVNNQLLKYNSTSSKWENWAPDYLTANQSITLSGDVTGTGSNSISTSISNAAVTFAKIQNVSGNSFLANVTGSAATVQEISTSRIPLFSSSITGTPSESTYLRGDGSWSSISNGITSLGVSGSPQTGSSQTLAVGTSGTNVNWVSSTDTHTLNIPDASATARGLITTGVQTIAGAKTFSGIAYFNNVVYLPNNTFDGSAAAFGGTNTATYLFGSYTYAYYKNIFNTAWSAGVLSNNPTAYLATNIFLQRAITAPSAGSYGLVATVVIKGTPITANTGSVTTAAALVVDGTTTGATNNYSIWAAGGNIRFDSLAGTGSRMVVADADGVMSTQAIPSGGSGTVTSVAFTTGTSGTDVNVSGSPITDSGTITLNIPDAGASARGLVTTGTQTIAGIKTFSGTTLFSNNTFNSATTNSATSGSPFLFGTFTTVGYKNGFNTAWAGASFSQSGSGLAFVSNLFAHPSVTAPSEGAYGAVVNVVIKGVPVNTNTGTITNAVALLIDGNTTGATNNYSIWVNGGTTRLDGAFELQGIASTTTANTLYYDATTKRVTYGAAPSGTVTSVALSTGTSGTDVNVSGSPITGSGTITLNIPSASATARGLVTTGDQTFNGDKTFTSTIRLDGTNTANAQTGTQIGRFQTTSSTYTVLSSPGIQGGFGVVSRTEEANTNYSYGNLLLATNTINKSATGTHNLFAQLVVKPIVVGTGAATLTNTASVYVQNASSGGTNNYAVWVDDGNVRIDTLGGTGTRMVVADADGVMSTQAIPTGGSGTVTSVAFTTGTTGTDVNVSGSPITDSGTITLNIPSASSTARGLVTTGSQTFAGSKTFNSTAYFDSAITANGNLDSYFLGNTTGSQWSQTDVRLTGGTSTFIGKLFRTPATTNTTPNNGTSFAHFVVGGITQNVSGAGTTFPIGANLAIKGLVVNNSSGTPTVTSYATLYIEGASTGTATITNNYALWVDDGNVRVDTLSGSGTRMVVADANGVMSTQAIPTGGSGTVTSVSVVSANGFAGTVATDTTTPAITISTTVTGLLKGNGTGISAAVAGTDYLTSALTSLGVSGSGQTGATQTLATGTTGTDFNISSATNTHTFNIPSASPSARGLVTTSLQTFAGVKIFQDGISVTAQTSNPFISFDSRSILTNPVSNFQILAGNTSYILGVAGNDVSTSLTQFYSHAQVVIGNQTYTEASTGTHALVTSLVVRPLILNNGSATTTNGATLYVEGAITGTATITNNYALWVDDGNVRIDTLGGSGTRMVVADANGVMSTQAIPGGSSAYNVTTQTTAYSVTETSGTVIVKGDTTSAGFTITLPTAVGNTATIIIKKVAGSGALVVDANGSETIDGGLTASLVKVNESITLISDNSNWQII